MRRGSANCKRTVTPVKIKPSLKRFKASPASTFYKLENTTNVSFAGDSSNEQSNVSYISTLNLEYKPMYNSHLLKLDKLNNTMEKSKLWNTKPIHNFRDKKNVVTGHVSKLPRQLDTDYK